jgi:hypothetical protein
VEEIGKWLREVACELRQAGEHGEDGAGKAERTVRCVRKMSRRSRELWWSLTCSDPPETWGRRLVGGASAIGLGAGVRSGDFIPLRLHC